MTINSCRKSGPAGEPVARRFGIHITAAQGQEYPAAFGQAHALGMTCLPLTLQWTDLERNGVYDPDSFLATADSFYGSQSTALSLCVSPIAADRRDWPPDLLAHSFDDPVVLERFERLLDSIHYKLKNTPVLYLLIGNEVDLYLAKHPAEWGAYRNFSQSVQDYIHVHWAGTLTGVETTVGAAIGIFNTEVKALQDGLDVVAATYYPLTDQFNMGPVSQVSDDLQQFLSQVAGRKIVMQECGYATGSLCRGSEEAQRSFIEAIFKFWDNHSEQLVFTGFLWLHDLDAQQALDVTNLYGLSGTPVAPAFTDYIRTLGLIDAADHPKPAFEALQKAIAQRDWAP